MKRLTAIFLGLGSGIGLAQGPPASAPNPVIRMDVNLVQVDAVVTDARNRRVGGLQPGDFEVWQDGKPQAITNFSYIDTNAGRGGRAAIRPKLLRGETPPPPPAPKPAEITRTMALVVDDLGLAGENFPRIRTAIRSFVDDQMRPGDLVAIVRTSAGMGSLQQFTTDKRLLYAALDRVQYGKSLNRVGVNSFAPLGSGGRGDAAFNLFREQTLTVGSLGAIRFVVNSMRGLPGRKSVVLFTEDIRLIYRGGADPLVEEALQQLNDAASRSLAVIHTIDPRGLMDYNVTAADNTSGMSSRRTRGVAGRRQQQVMNGQQGMTELADQSGGLFLSDMNDLSAALRQAADDSNGYYLIGYHPDADTFQPGKNGKAKFHKIEVKVKKAGLTVRSRDGFFGEPGGDQLVERMRDADLNRALQSPFAVAAIHPRLTAVFSYTPQAGSFIDALLYLEPGELRWSTDPRGGHKVVIDIAAATFDENGVALKPVNGTLTFQLDPQQYDVALKKGLVSGMHVPVAKPGPYLVRAALRDPASGGSGSAQQFVEVPNLAGGHLAMSGILLREAAALPAVVGLDGSPPGQDLTSGAARIIRRGTAVLYRYDIFNARCGADRALQLETHVRLFHDGEQVPVENHESMDTGAERSGTPQPRVGGRLVLGQEMPPGEYVLQVIVTDKLANSKFRTATQSLDFEIEP
jgi:VWFA-related protein